MWIHGIELRSLELAQIPLTFETGFLFLGSYYSFWLYCMRKKSMRVSVVDIKSQASCHTSLITYPMVKKSSLGSDWTTKQDSLKVKIKKTMMYPGVFPLFPNILTRQGE